MMLVGCDICDGNVVAVRVCLVDTLGTYVIQRTTSPHPGYSY